MVSEQAAHINNIRSEYQKAISTINSMQNTITSQQDTITSLKTTSITQNDSIAAIKSRADTQQISLFDFQTQLTDVKTTSGNHDGQLSTLKSRTDSQDQTLSNLQTQVSNALHVEQGTISCGNSNNNDWNEGSVKLYDYNLAKSKSVSQSFNKKYSRPPVVFLSTSQRYTETDKYVLYGTGLRNVTSTGFQLVCGSNAYPTYLVGHLQISWTSFSV